MMLPLPNIQIHSDSDEGDGAIKYTISGEGAGTIFIIDEITGDIHATERLDREEKTFYTLRAQARDRLTDRPLEPESEFIIKVQDINDSEPKFLEGPYIGSVPELSPIVKPTAAEEAKQSRQYASTSPVFNPQIHSDSDEGDGAIKYTISGEGAGTIFIIDEITGDIHATERLDREEKTFYTLRAQARDRLTDRPLEPESEFIIKVQDINDSEPKFLEGPYIGSVPELSPIGKMSGLGRREAVWS
ncbi:UNVERIFIED_CONTAM: hypothetical protein FKN15_014552 [Acipenser sinensis]